MDVLRPARKVAFVEVWLRNTLNKFQRWSKVYDVAKIDLAGARKFVVRIDL
jgi:hypothetical protein